MAQLNLNRQPERVDTSLDNVTIISCLEMLVGGKVLETKGFAPEVINAGHIIIRDKQNANDYKPMPVAEKAYDTLPENHEIVGVLQCSILTSQPLASIMVRGAVNKESSPYPVTAEIEKSLPLIRFTKQD